MAPVGAGGTIMATEKVGIYRKYHGPIPTDRTGKPLPKSEWPRKRAFRWAVRWFGSDGKRYSKSFKTRKEAEQFAETKQSEVRKGKANPPPEINLRQFYKEHRALMEHSVARSTLRLQLTAIRLLAGFIGWTYYMKRITSRDIERFRAARLRTGLSPSSSNRELRTLKRLLNLAIARGYLTKGDNPCFGIHMIKVPLKKPKYCGPQEFSDIYRAAPDVYWKSFLVSAYTTGLRLEELLNLTWADIDFERAQVQVIAKNQGEWVQRWRPKDYEMRTVPLSEQAVDLLTTWQSVAPENCPYVLMERERWTYYRQQVSHCKWRESQSLVNNVLRRFKTICRRARVGPYSIHDLRRSCITNWAQSLPIHVVQQLAGHSDIRTTQRYYLSVTIGDIKKAQKVQSRLLGRIPDRDLTDPKLTHSARIRAFPNRRTDLPRSQCSFRKGLT
jgi:integrase